MLISIPRFIRIGLFGLLSLLITSVFPGLSTPSIANTVGPEKSAGNYVRNTRFAKTNPEIKLNFSKRTHLSSYRPLQPLRIPFRYVNGFLIVDVIINDRLPLSFIFDTGSKHTILTEFDMVPLLGQMPQEEIKIIGSDLGTPISGKILRRTSFLAGNVNLDNQSLIILDGDILDLKELTGEVVHGILGIGSFGAYGLKVDYNRQVIELIKPASLKIHKNTVILPIRVEESKAYLDVEADIHPGKTQTLSLLIDTGASLSLLINTSSADSTLYPPKLVTGTFGYGLGGYLIGYVGRSDLINLGPHSIPNVITHFQTITSDSSYTKLPVREGILGNGILDNFTFTIVSSKNELHLQPIKKPKKRPAYDRSGMRLIRGGKNLNKFRVQHIVKNSPADRADIRIGDELLKIRSIPVTLKSLSQTEKILRGRVGKKIRVSIGRNEEVIKTQFLLEDLI